MRALITITMALSALRGPLWGVDANPHLLACETPLDGTARVMGEFPAFEGVDTPNAIVSLTHEDGSAFYCSGAPGAEPGAREYVPGEDIEFELLTPSDGNSYQYVWSLEGPGAADGNHAGMWSPDDPCAKCPGSRRSSGADPGAVFGSCYRPGEAAYTGPAILKAPTDGRPLHIRAAFAKAKERVTLVDCVLTMGAGGTIAPTTETWAPSTMTPTSGDPEGYEADIIIVGAGLAGVMAAFAARQADPEASIAILAASLEEATTAYSGGWLWLPNNELAGAPDPKDQFVEYAASIAYPDGAPDWALEALEAFWESSPTAMEALGAAGVQWGLQYDMTGSPFPDYYGSTTRPGNALPRGRIVRAFDETFPPPTYLSGLEMMRKIRNASKPDLVLEGYIANDVVETEDATVVTASVASNPTARGVRVAARRAVVFATGGKIHGLGAGERYDVDATVTGACASPFSALDAIAALPNVEVANKGNIWQYEVGSTGSPIWFLWFGQPGGDFVVVDRRGHRVYNEGLSYNQRGEFHVLRETDEDGESRVRDDPQRKQLYLVYGPRAHAYFDADLADGTKGYGINPFGDAIETDLENLKGAIEGAAWYDGFNVGLANSFDRSFRVTIDDFNAAAAENRRDPAGRGDPDGEGYESSLAWRGFGCYLMGYHTGCGDRNSPFVRPFWGNPDAAAETPLFVRPLNYGGIDTKMGPKADPKTQRVLHTSRVFVAGNAAASPFGQAYTAPGNTLGYALVSGYVAGTAAANGVPTFVWDGEPFLVPPGPHRLPASAPDQVLVLHYPGRNTVARSYGGYPWEGFMPDPLEVTCDGDDEASAMIRCAATLPEGLWLQAFSSRSGRRRLDEAARRRLEDVPGGGREDRAFASRFLEMATFGADTDDIDDFVGFHNSDPVSWLEYQRSLPCSKHRDHFRERAHPLMTATCRAGPMKDQCEAGANLIYPRGYSWYFGDGDRYNIPNPHTDENAKTMPFVTLALSAEDQLCQKKAWSLSKIFVVGENDVPASDEDTEIWLKYHDVFVENADGSLFDILKNITYSPMMGTYLTYEGSEQFDKESGNFPDENYGREIMQLFSVGMVPLNPDGTPVAGADPVYGEEDVQIMARAFTGFAYAPLRSNYELDQRRNLIDDMIIYPNRRDGFPKPDLTGGYVGDGYPLCDDLLEPLVPGASFERVPDDDGAAAAVGPNHALYGLLCAPNDGGACTFPDRVVLTEAVAVAGYAAPTVYVDASTRRRSARVVYKFAPRPCVHLAFFDDGEMSTQDGRQTCEDAAAPFWVRGAGADAPAYAGETYLASMMGATQRVSSMSLEDMEMEMLAADLAVEMKATADARASEREAARLEDEMMAPPCEDDAAFRLNGVEFRDCGWVAKKPAKRCEDARARAACPLTCGACGGASIGRRLQASETIFVAWFVPSGDGPLPDVYAAAGDAVFIAVPPGHSVWRMASQAAWTACDFTGAVEVAAVADAARDAAVDVATGETGYFACDQGAHCANGMKARVVVASIADECAASFDFGALEPTPWPGGVANQNQNQDDAYEVGDDGCSLEVTGNTWIMFDLAEPHVVDAFSRLDFCVQIRDECEIHAISTGLPVDAEVTFVVGGTQDDLGDLVDFNGLARYADGGCYQVPLAPYHAPGQVVERVGFVSDCDSGASASATWSRVELSRAAGECAVKAQVHKTGAVGVVHAPSNDVALMVDSQRQFRAYWNNDRFPTVETGCLGCEREDLTCVCDARVSWLKGFNSIPTRDEVLAELDIGSPVGDPAANDAYALHESSAGVDVWVTEASLRRQSGPFDKKTIFGVVDRVGRNVFLANKISVVDVGDGYRFRNPPHFPSLSRPATVPECVAETDAVLASLAEHPNICPFIAKNMIQSFSTSNPAPRYVNNVVTACQTGAHDGRTYSGKYGDVGAMVDAILTDREALSTVVLSDPNQGKLHHPLDKALHFMRALEFTSTFGTEVEMGNAQNKLGQQVHYAPSVFSYSPPFFAPNGVISESGLYAPEANFLGGSKLLGYVNGLRAMPRYGLSSSPGNVGLGREGRSHGYLGFAPRSPAAACAVSSILDGRAVGTVNTWIAETESRRDVPQWAHHNPSPRVDLSYEGGEAQALLKFDLSAYGAGCRVASATLTLRSREFSSGSEILGYRVAGSAAWDADATWDSVGGGVDATRRAAEPSFSFLPPFHNEYVEMDVTADVRTWADGEAENQGWVFVATSENGFTFYQESWDWWATRLEITTTAGDDVVDELDVLLTGGRLSPEARDVIADAYDAGETSETRLRAALNLFTLTPEFQATCEGEPGEPAAPPPPPPPSNRDFKAAIMLFFHGGMDSHTTLVPREGCRSHPETGVPLDQQYIDYRAEISQMPFEVRSTYLPIETEKEQACEVFGVHPSMTDLRDVYQEKELAFFANVGALVEPMTLEDFVTGAKPRPPGIQAHDVQQEIAQTLNPMNMAARGVMGSMLRTLQEGGDSTVGYFFNGDKPRVLEGAPEDVDMSNNADGVNTVIDSDAADFMATLEALGVNRESSCKMASVYQGAIGAAIHNQEELLAIVQNSEGVPDANFDTGTGLGTAFLAAANVIKQRDVLEKSRMGMYIQIGGFDNHGTLDALPEKLVEINNAITAFREEMQNQGVWDDVVIATASDFGRTQTSNGAGTDHGWGGHHFMAGGAINGSQIHCRFPETIGPGGDMNYDDNRGRLVPSCGYENMWAPLATFMGVPDEKLEDVIPNLRNFQDTSPDFPDLLTFSDVFKETDRPTVAPAVEPTPAPVARKTASDVCGGVAGEDEIDGKHLHCLELDDGRVVDVVVVEGRGENPEELETCRYMDANQCPEGFDIWVPTDYEHAAAVVELARTRYEEHFTHLVGVYRARNGCGPCSDAVMNSAAMDEWVAADPFRRSLGQAWTSVSGGPWWLRDGPYGEPNGDYTAGCWLTMAWGGFRTGDYPDRGWAFNDYNCNYCFSDYFCSTNEPQAPPSPNPSPEPTPETPYPTGPTAEPTAAPTVADPCGGRPGEVAYGDHTVRCFEVDGEVANVIEIEAGDRTCAADQDNSCPDGWDIWVPHSLEHARVISDAVSPHYRTLVGIYRAADGVGAGGSYAMNSDAQAAYEAAGDGNLGWTSVAPRGEPWVLRHEEYHHPYGDNYVANCWMEYSSTLDPNEGFNFWLNSGWLHGNCVNCYERYMCSTNRMYALQPSLAPTTAEPTAPPERVCEGKTGTKTHVDEETGVSFEVECLYIDDLDAVVDIVPIRGGMVTNSRDRPNSCPAGTNLWVPRSYDHASAVRQRWPHWHQTTGIFRRFGGCGGCQDIPMNSEAQEAWEAEDPNNNVGWQAVAAGPWFLRSEPWSYMDGDYTPNCWIHAWNWENGVGFHVNDNWCRYSSGNYYLCSTNWIDRLPAPSPAPTSVPTPLPTVPPTPLPSIAPTTSSPTMHEVCEGRVGEFDYTDETGAAFTLFCLEVEGEIVNYVEVRNGAQTCSRLHDNSCPVGFHLWVPRSLAHEQAVTDAVEPRLLEISGVYRAESGCGGCEHVAMNKEAQQAWVAEAPGRVGWRSVAPLSQPWYLRETAFELARQPHNSYTADCWVQNRFDWWDGVEPNQGFRFQTDRCRICRRNYLCSTNVAEATPTPAPTVPDKTADPEPKCAFEGAQDFPATEDVELNERFPDTVYQAHADQITVDGNERGRAVRALVKFDFARARGCVPRRATLRVFTRDQTGATVSAYRATEAWDEESATWNSLNGMEPDGEPAFELDAPRNRVFATVDVTALVAAWIAEPEENHGLVFVNPHRDGWDFYTSDHSDRRYDVAPTIDVDFGDAADDAGDLLCDEENWVAYAGERPGWQGGGSAWRIGGCAALQTSLHPTTTWSLAALPEDAHAWSNFELSVDVTPLYNDQSGVVFRGSGFGPNHNQGQMYYVALHPLWDGGKVRLGRIDNSWRELARAPASLAYGKSHKLEVLAYACHIHISIDGVERIHVEDCSFASGSVGLRTWNAMAEYRNLRVREIPAPTAAPTAAPTPLPSIAPTTAAPTAPPARPCEGTPGTRTYVDANGDSFEGMRCIDVPDLGGVVDVVPIQGGAEIRDRFSETSCPAGMAIWVPKSYDHGNAVRQMFHHWQYRITGIYRSEDGCGGCTQVAMNSEDQKAYEAEGFRGSHVGFKSIASGPWFLRSTTYSEPNGDYDANCWLGLHGGWDEDVGFRFNDARCNVRSTNYLCSSNWVDKLPPPSAAPTMAPTLEPTLPPTSASPTVTPPRVCNGVVGSKTYVDPTGAAYDAACYEIGDLESGEPGGVVDVVVVTGGELTRRRTDPNSCPEGMDIWVPRSLEHARLITSTYSTALTTIVGVYRDGPGEGWNQACGGCTSFAMNSVAQQEYEAQDPSACSQGACVGWTSVAGPHQPWFMRREPFGEPNGDYTQNCWLNARWRQFDDDLGFGMNDWNCNYASSSYLCSSNWIDRLPPADEGPGCSEGVDFSVARSHPFGTNRNQDESTIVDGRYRVVGEGGCGVSFVDNAWRAFELASPFVVEATSTLNLCFEVTNECEVYGVSPVETEAQLGAGGDIFVLAGTQDVRGDGGFGWNHDYAAEYSTGTQCYSIDLTAHYEVGTTFEYVAFVNDCDSDLDHEATWTDVAFEA